MQRYTANTPIQARRLAEWIFLFFLFQVKSSSLKREEEYAKSIVSTEAYKKYCWNIQKRKSRNVNFTYRKVAECLRLSRENLCLHNDTSLHLMVKSFSQLVSLFHESHDDARWCHILVCKRHV